MKIDIQEAEVQFSKLGKPAWQGEEVVITKAGEPYLWLEPYREKKTKRKLGSLKGKIWIAPDFDETDQETIDSFYNSKISPDKNYR